MTETSPENSPEPAPARKEGGVAGIIMIAVGALLLADNLIPRFDFSDYWPLILVVFGISLIWKSRQSR